MTHRAFLGVAIAATTVLLAGGCTGKETDDPPRSSSQSRTTDATNAESADTVTDTEADIDIGGRTLYLRCWGQPVPDEPTILLLAGSGPTTSSWEPLAVDLASDRHHLCAYDRLGVGRSAAVLKSPRATKDQVDDLIALLDAAGLQEPVVVVAHSLGSLPAVGLVDRAPQRVAGVVLVDPRSPRVSAAARAALPPEKPNESPELAAERRFLNDYLYDPAQNPEHLLLADNEEEVKMMLDEPGPIFGDLPVVLLQAPELPFLPGLTHRYHEANVAAIAKGNEELVAESRRGTLIKVEDTGHNIQDDQPEVVMDAILDVLAG
jgi:pimeloyl-ACP methyl ester carboxylesterase